VFRKFTDRRFENLAELFGDEWRLREQIDGLTKWLRDHPDALDPTQQWVGDIGFCVRGDAAGGRLAISRELMAMCTRSNLEIMLSEYLGDAQQAAAADERRDVRSASRSPSRIHYTHEDQLEEEERLQAECEMPDCIEAWQDRPNDESIAREAYPEDSPRGRPR